MHPDRDFDARGNLVANEAALTQDLGLDILVGVMAGSDPFLGEVARRALLSNPVDGVEGIVYRQDILKDCLAYPDVARSLYAIAQEAIEGRKKHWFGVFSRYPGGILRDSVELMQMFVGILKKLRHVADDASPHSSSKGLSTLFAMLQRELDDPYLSEVEGHLERLAFRSGVLVSAGLGAGNEGVDYVLHHVLGRKRGFWERLFGPRDDGYTIHIAERDEAGAKALGELRDRGINLVANAVAQSTDHVHGFFDMLRTETAFYVGCLNLRDHLTALGAPTSIPRADPPTPHLMTGRNLYDPGLALSTGRRLVGNDVSAAARSLVVITGANQGGKSSFLRAIGLAQLMMQSGMFVAAEEFSSAVCPRIFTHFKREEDTQIQSGKLDEELRRMSAIADAITRDSLLLLNESFSATNEREGSEIARQVVSALLERGIRVAFVTHLHGFAREFHDQRASEGVFLRAERLADGTRTFRLVEGAPLETSFGADVYKEIFPGAYPAAATPGPSIS